MPKTQCPLGRAGFTLLEILLAMLIFSVSSLAILGLFLSSRSADRAGLGNVRASALASSELAKTKTLPYSVLVGQIGSPAPPTTLKRDGIDYRIVTTVQRLSSNVSSNDYALLDIRLEVSWDQKKSFDFNGKDQLHVGSSQTHLVMHSVIGPSTNL